VRRHGIEDTAESMSSIRTGHNRCSDWIAAAADQPPQHFLNFLPLPQGQGSLRPILGGAM
jgi:hypothetical protein